MGFLGFSQRLLPEPMNEICQPICDLSSDWGYCEPPCLTFCSIVCPSQIPPPIPSISVYQHLSRTNKVLINALVALTAAFALVTLLAAYVKLYSGPRRRRRAEEEARNETHDNDFFDEDNGLVLDHPIWYINTIGLQPSVISSISICN